MATREETARRPPRSARRRLLGLAGAVGLVVLLYLVLSLAIPREVPRLAILPRPAATSSEGCDGGPGAQVTRRWERWGPLWSLTTMRACGGRIPG